MLAIVTGAETQAWDRERRALVAPSGDALTGTDRVTPVGFSADEPNWSAARLRAGRCFDPSEWGPGDRS